MLKRWGYETYWMNLVLFLLAICFKLRGEEGSSHDKYAIITHLHDSALLPKLALFAVFFANHVYNWGEGPFQNIYNLREGPLQNIYNLREEPFQNIYNLREGLFQNMYNLQEGPFQNIYDLREGPFQNIYNLRECLFQSI